MSNSFLDAIQKALKATVKNPKPATTLTRAEVIRRLVALRAGLLTQYPPNARGKFSDDFPGNRADLVTLVDALLAPMAASTKAELEAARCRAVVSYVMPVAVEVLDRSVSLVKTMHFREPGKLKQYGMTVPKPRRKPTAKESLIKAVKQRETRKLRGTLGKKQKKRLKFSGQVDVKTGPKPAN